MVTHTISASLLVTNAWKKPAVPETTPTLISYFYPAASQSILPSLSLQPSPLPEFSNQVPSIRADSVTQTGPTKPSNPLPAEIIPLGRLQRSTTTLFWLFKPVASKSLFFLQLQENQKQNRVV